jgi:uncharacterized protein
VNTSLHSFKFNAGFLVKQAVGSYRDLQFDAVLARFEDDLEVKGVQGEVRLSRTVQGMLVQGKFTGEIQAQCGRCLEDCTQEIHADFDELYTFKSNEATESDFVLPEDANIDLTPILRELFVLDIPIKSLCKPDCKGLCPVCGLNRNLYACEHQSVSNDFTLPNQVNPWGVLEKLKK